MKKLQGVLLIFILPLAFAFTDHPTKKNNKMNDPQKFWVDSVFNSLNDEQRIAQLFMVAAYSNKGVKHVKEIKELIAKYNIGGLIWMQGGPMRQGQLADYYQRIAKTPLLYGIDGEWGLAMRLDSTPRYPKQMTLGAIQNDTLIYKMGRQIGRECRRLGIHINFAPVADVNNNPFNPVIGIRSFGENKFKVAVKAAQYMKGLQDEFVMANAKHFPGHGDTDSDSHKKLPQLAHSRERLDSLELYPFKYLFENNLKSVMIAHLNVSALDTTQNLPSTLSPLIVNNLLKKELGFKGLVFTDALNMSGVAKNSEPGVVDAKALLAGNDVLLFSENVPKAIQEITKAILDGKISRDEVNEKCKRVLEGKFWCGLNKKQEIVTRNLYKDLNSKESLTLNDELAEAAITVLKNENSFLPIKEIDSLKIITVSFGVEESNTLFQTLKDYSYIEHVGLSHDAKWEKVLGAFEKINRADLVIIQLNKASTNPSGNFGIGMQSLRLIDSIATLKPSVLSVFTTPYILNKLPSITNYKSIIVAYEYLPSLLKATANVIVGKISANGQLPVSTNYYKSGHGLQTTKSSVFKIVSSGNFSKIDSIAFSGIQEHAYPSCQIVALKDGQVYYQKSFGNYTYNDNSKLVDNGSYYDLASITKIAASALALMKLQSEKKFDYKNTLGFYLPELVGTNKENLVIEDVLAHQAGLQPWIPFYLKTIDKKGNLKDEYYSNKKSDEFPTQVAKKLFVVKNYGDSLYQKIIESKLENKGKYVYSDLGYYFIQRIIEKQSGKTIDDYVKDIYAQLGIGLSYLPLNFLSKKQIVPTENDEKFRKQIIQGYVHDPAAALMGGVAGHAGLFGNALDLAKLMQLFLNKGFHNGIQLLDSNVVKDYTACHFCPKNRRGLCFEKPEPDATKDSPVTSECSLESFGHAGFTGTLAWADPENQLVFVFLSNRVFPNAEENKLVKLGIRGKIHKAFYESLKVSKTESVIKLSDKTN